MSNGHAWRGVTASLCILVGMLLSSCGKSEPEIRAVDDPAMRPPPVAGITVTEVARESAAPAVPTTLRYNDGGDRIFVPGTGWLDADEFWDHYHNDPAKLPAGLDLGALHVLGPPPKAEQVAAADA